MRDRTRWVKCIVFAWVVLAVLSLKIASASIVRLRRNYGLPYVSVLIDDNCYMCVGRHTQRRVVHGHLQAREELELVVFTLGVIRYYPYGPITHRFFLSSGPWGILALSKRWGTSSDGAV